MDPSRHDEQGTRPSAPSDDGSRTRPADPRAVVTVVIACVGAVVLGLLTYGSAVFGDYGRLDDYGYVASSRTGTLSWLRDFYLDSGRPLPAVVMTSLAPQVGTVDALVWFRLASTSMIALGAAMAALLAYRLAAPASRTTGAALAAIAAAAALSTTSTPSTATWAILAGSAYAFAAAMAAGLVATSPVRRWWFPSTVLIVIAAFSYQHIAPIAVLPTLLWSTERWASRRSAQWSRTFVVGGVVVIALLANFAMVRARDGVGTSRITQVSTSERLRWFATEFVPQTLDVSVPGTTTSLVWSLVLLAGLLLTPLLAGPRYLACSAAVVIAWAGTSVVVIPVELWASYRLASGSQFVLWVGAAACLAIGVARARHRFVRTGVAAAGAMLGVVALVVSDHRADDYLAVPNEVDWHSMQCVAREEDLEAGSRIVLNEWGHSTSPVIDMDEFGIVASSVPWAFPPAMWLAETSVEGAAPDFGPEGLEVIPVGADTTGGVVVAQDGTCRRAAGTARSTSRGHRPMSGALSKG